MDSKYYYFRDTQNKPRITVCLLKVGGQTARGIAICSMLDNPCKTTGRNIAKGRAHKAMFAEESSCPINRKTAFDVAYDAFGEIYFESIYKSTYAPLLTDFERKLLTTLSEKHIQQEIPLGLDDKIRPQTK